MKIPKLTEKFQWKSALSGDSRLLLRVLVGALLAAQGSDAASRDAVRCGVEWLAASQRSDGTWDEPQYTGTGFPRDFYINYHLYRLAFPLSALGRYVRALEEGASA